MDITTAFHSSSSSSSSSAAAAAAIDNTITSDASVRVEVVVNADNNDAVNDNDNDWWRGVTDFVR